MEKHDNYLEIADGLRSLAEGTAEAATQDLLAKWLTSVNADEPADAISTSAAAHRLDNCNVTVNARGRNMANCNFNSGTRSDGRQD